MQPELTEVEHVPEERADLFWQHDGGSTELEYLELVRSFVRVFKPNNILETGALKGWGTRALAEAAKANGFGHVWTCEYDPQWVAYTRKHMEDQWLTDLVTIVEGDSRVQIPTIGQQFDFAFFDSDLPIRCEEFQLCIDKQVFNKGAWAAFHDTSRLRLWAHQPDQGSKKFWTEMDALIAKYNITQRIEFPLSRGLLLLKVPEQGTR